MADAIGLAPDGVVRAARLCRDHPGLHGGDSLGVGHARRAQDTLALTQLGLSVLPAGLGWLAIVDIIPAGLAVALLLFGFIALYLADLRAVRLELAPRWYPALRKPLTLGVVLCLLATWLGVMLVG